MDKLRSPGHPLFAVPLPSIFLLVGRQEKKSNYFFLLLLHNGENRDFLMKIGQNKFYFPEVPRTFWVGGLKASKQGYSKHFLCLCNVNFKNILHKKYVPKRFPFRIF